VKAIILAAGQGTRLKPLTDAIPKCLVPFRGKPILDHILFALHETGIADITVVTGYRDDAVVARGIPTRHNPEFASTNMVRSLFCAEDLLEGDDVLVVYGDIVFRSALAHALSQERAPISVAVNTQWRELWQLRMSDPLADAETLKLDAKGNIVELGKKARSYEEIQGQYTGLIRIAREALPRVRAFYHALDQTRLYDGKNFHNMFMTSFLQEIIDHLMPIKAVLVGGGWVEIDSIEDLLAYEKLPEGFFA